MISACSSVERKPEKLKPGRSEAETLLNKIVKKNEGLNTYKGVGSFSLIQNGEKNAARMAFMCRYPSSLRIEVISPTGQPVYSFSAHDRTFYFYSHFDNLFYKTRSFNSSLNRLISMEINVDDVSDLLSGRIPVKPYSRVLLEKNQTDNGWILTLKKRWPRLCEKIHLDESQTKIHKIEFLTSKSKLIYCAELEGSIKIRNFDIPKKITLTDSEGTVFSLRIDGYEANFEIAEEDEERFILKSKE